MTDLVAPSSTKTCPDGSRPDANGNCLPSNTNQNPQAPDHHKPKGGDLGQQLLPGD
jgi:hypothetical protein